MGISGWVKRLARGKWKKYFVRTLPAGDDGAWLTAVFGPGESESEPGPLLAVGVGSSRDEGFRWGRAAAESLGDRGRRRAT